MAKGIVVGFEGEVSTFALTRVDREKLYGRKVKVIVDEKGEPCQAAYLTADGSALLPAGCLALVPVDAAFDAFERSELIAVDALGNPRAVAPSTLGVEQPLSGPVDPRRVLDFSTKSLYQLAPEALGPKLLAGLEAGGIFETRFNWREDWDDSACFLLKNDAGIFALIGEEARFEFLRRDAELVSDGAEADSADDDLDFGMM